MSENNVRIRLFFLGLILFCNVAKATINNECEAVMKSIDSKVYSLLADHNSGGELEKAFDLLESSRSQCATSPEWEAQLFDLRGYIAARAYKLSQDKDFYDMALQSFQKALGYNVPRSEYVYYHLAGLMRLSGEQNKGIQYINKALNFEPAPKDPLPYLKLALQLAVDVKDWKAVQDLIEIVTKRDSYHFYENPDLVLSLTIAFCHDNDLAPARMLIEKNEKYMRDTNNQNDRAWIDILEQAKKVVGSCPVSV